MTDPEDELEDALRRIREDREAYEALAESDLPIANYCQNALDALEEADGE